LNKEKNDDLNKEKNDNPNNSVWIIILDFDALSGRLIFWLDNNFNSNEKVKNRYV